MEASHCNLLSCGKRLVMPDFDAVSLQQRPKLRKLDDYSPQLFEPLTFFDMTPRFRDGSDTPRAYLERCLAVIADREPVVKAWVLLNPSGAREVADASTERYRRGLPFSPIDGMPIGIEDLIETKDMPTGHGCAAFARNHTRRDSAIVQALRDAGAVVLGIDCDDRDGRRVSGPDHQSVRPRADAGRLVERFSRGDRRLHGTAAIGTQVGGSLIRPASYCGNCALKPTMGALHRGERQGYSQSHVGVHAGSLTDMWRVAMEIARRAGGDPGEPGLFGAPELSPALQPDRLMGYPVILTKAGGGIAASADAFALVMLGHAGVRLYDASLSEWATDPTLPMETG